MIVQARSNIDTLTPLLVEIYTRQPWDMIHSSRGAQSPFTHVRHPQHHTHPPKSLKGHTHSLHTIDMKKYIHTYILFNTQSTAIQLLVITILKRQPIEVKTSTLSLSPQHKLGGYSPTPPLPHYPSLGLCLPRRWVCLWLWAGSSHPPTPTPSHSLTPPTPPHQPRIHAAHAEVLSTLCTDILCMSVDVFSVTAIWRS